MLPLFESLQTNLTMDVAHGVTSGCSPTEIVGSLSMTPYFSRYKRLRVTEPDQLHGVKELWQISREARVFGTLYITNVRFSFTTMTCFDPLPSRAHNEVAGVYMRHTHACCGAQLTMSCNFVTCAPLFASNLGPHGTARKQGSSTTMFNAGQH